MAKQSHERLFGKVVLITVFLTLLLGCATRRFDVKNANLSHGKTTKRMLIEPWQSLGAEFTEAMRQGEITVVQGVAHDVLLGAEYSPGRFRWPAWAVGKDGREFFGQALFSGINRVGDFIFTIIWDGKYEDTKDARGVILSTALEYGYDLYAKKEFSLNLKDFVRDTRGYRTKLVWENGTRIGDLPTVSGVFDAMRRWNRYESKDKKLVLYSPLSKDLVKQIAAINPQYSPFQKLVGEAPLAVSIDPISTALSITWDVFRSFTGRIPDRGWNFSEPSIKRQQGLILAYIGELRKQLIRSLNKELQRGRRNEKVSFSFSGCASTVS